MGKRQEGKEGLAKLVVKALGNTLRITTFSQSLWYARIIAYNWKTTLHRLHLAT